MFGEVVFGLFFLKVGFRGVLVAYCFVSLCMVKAWFDGVLVDRV